jgi:hypothetical protein
MCPLFQRLSTGYPQIQQIARLSQADEILIQCGGHLAVGLVAFRARAFSGSGQLCQFQPGGRIAQTDTALGYFTLRA